MIEVRFHGRGGQGAQVASKILAVSFFHEGFFVQSFPAFGVERRGAPVMAFLRVDQQPVLLRVNIYEPDHIVVLDPTLIGAVDVTSGLKPKGWILINSGQPPEAFRSSEGFSNGYCGCNLHCYPKRLRFQNEPNRQYGHPGCLFEGDRPCEDRIHCLSHPRGSSWKERRERPGCKRSLSRGEV